MKNAWVHYFLTISVFAMLFCHSSWHTIDAQPPTTRGVLDTQGIIIRDKNGAVKARLGTKSDGSAVLTFLDNEQHARIEIGLHDDTLPAIHLLDEKQRPRLMLSVKEKKGTCVTVLDSNGRGVFELSTLADGTVQEFFFDQSGGQRIRQIVRPEGKAELCLLGIKERSGIWMRVSEIGEVRQSFFDRDEKERITLNVDPTGSSLDFFGGNRKGRIATSVTANGTALNVLYDENGNRRIGSYVRAKGPSSHVLFGRNGKPGLVLSADVENPASLKCCDLNGIPKAGVSVGPDGEPSYFLLQKPGIGGKDSKTTSKSNGLGDENSDYLERTPRALVSQKGS